MNPRVSFDAWPQSSSSSFCIFESCVFAFCATGVLTLLTAVSLNIHDQFHESATLAKRAMRGHRELQPRVLRESVRNALAAARAAPPSSQVGSSGARVAPGPSAGHSPSSTPCRIFDLNLRVEKFHLAVAHT